MELAVIYSAQVVKWQFVFSDQNTIDQSFLIVCSEDVSLWSCVPWYNVHVHVQVGYSILFYSNIT